MNVNDSIFFIFYAKGIEVAGKYKMILNSDATEFGGFNRVDATKIHHTFPEGYAGRRNHLCAYIPSRTCFAFAKIEAK